MSSNIDVLNRKQRGMSCARITKCMAPYKDCKVLNMASGTCGAHTVDDTSADMMRCSFGPWNDSPNHTCARNKASVRKDEQHDDDARFFQTTEDSHAGW